MKSDVIFPNGLFLWNEEEKLKYKVLNANLSENVKQILKNNKDFFLNKLKSNTASNKFQLVNLSENQKGLWFIHQLNPDIKSYYISFAGLYDNNLNIDLLKKSLDLSVNKYSLLRGTIDFLPDNPDIVSFFIWEKINNYFEIINCEKLNQTELDQYLIHIYSDKIDLKTGPLFKIYCIKSFKGIILLFKFHHIICDAWSLKLFLRDLNNFYNKLLLSENINENTSSKDYQDYIIWMNYYLNNDTGKKHLNYWMENLNDISELDLNNKKTDVFKFNGSTERQLLNSGLYQRIIKYIDNKEITVNVFLYTLFQLFIFLISKQNNFFIGIPVVSRSSKDFENIFGYFINTIPLKSELTKDLAFKDLLNINKNIIYTGLNAQSVPFSLIVEKAGIKRNPAKTPVFQVLYNYLNEKILGELSPFLLSGVKSDSLNALKPVSPVFINDQEGQFDLTFEIFDNNENFEIKWKYNTDLFDNLKIEEFKKFFLLLLNNILDSDYNKLTINNLSGLLWSNDDILHYNKNKIIISGNFTVEPIKKYLDFWLNEIGYSTEIKFAGYNQIFQELIDPNSLTNSNNGYNIILVRLEEWIDSNNNEKINEFISALKNFSEQIPLIILSCPFSDKIINNKIILNNLNDIEKNISEIVSVKSNITFVPSFNLLSMYEKIEYYEPLGETVGHIPFTNDFFLLAAVKTARLIYNAKTPGIKAIAVDCDNTLWKGVAAEDGYNNVKIEKQNLELQNFLIEQYDRGILICLCSKNNEKDVFEVFEKNKSMILKKDHIHFYRINWNSKSSNIRELSEEINIGIDSFVFIDDNQSEIAEVKSDIPQVISILFNDKIDMNRLKNFWIFDYARITKEDKKRTELYKIESQRINLEKQINNYKEFLDKLNLEIKIAEVSNQNAERISQLTYRTNQFNFSGKKREIPEINNIIKSKIQNCFMLDLKDRFGDYGITGVFITGIKNNVLTVDTFLLSCRVLGKGVEHKCISFLADFALKNNLKELFIPFIKTERNIPAEQFLDKEFKQYKNNDGYLIPAETAVKCIFNPDSGNINKVKEVSVNTSVNFIERNNFIYKIIDNYGTFNEIKSYYNKDSINIIKQDNIDIQGIITALWKKLLNINQLSINDNFFDIGGYSLLTAQFVIQIKKEYNIDVEIVDCFKYPTVKSLSEYIINKKSSGSIKAEYSTETDKRNLKDNKNKSREIAIIGMAGRFPGADNVGELWENLINGKDCITDFTDEELLESGVPEELLKSAKYVKRGGVIKRPEYFDAKFFSYMPKEAELIDHQQKIFLECSYQALENAGYNPFKIEKSAGVFAGSGINNYLLKNLLSQSDLMESVVDFMGFIGNEKDFLATRVSYKLNLKGPSLTIQTACSTSMVCVQKACQSLLDDECYMALAGGVSVYTPRMKGYLYTPGQILSDDGYCRSFDKNASGTVFGEGAGVVVLKRLEDAVKDKDRIHCVIIGAAINNDGSDKVGYTAPGYAGQVEVITKAIQSAGINTNEIGYIETHGTGTKLGDPLEFSALKNIFLKNGNNKKHCYLGSVKPNIGHLDVAAGISSLIKTVLILKNKKIPPLINYKEPNAEIDLDNSPFIINKEKTDWRTENKKPRIAGVSCFGIGGTNVHCVLKEYDEIKTDESFCKNHLIPISAKSEFSLDEKYNCLLKDLNKNINIGDLVYTLQKISNGYQYRSVITGSSKEDFINNINFKKKNTIYKNKINDSDPNVVFMFSGQGSQKINMFKDIYDNHECFKDIADYCFNYYKNKFNFDIKQVLFSDDNNEKNLELLNKTFYTQPALFIVEYALAKTLMYYGIKPSGMLGHSIGEITAAAIGNVVKLDDALELIYYRAELMQSQSEGIMLSLNLSGDDIKPLLTDGVEISLYNTPELTVVGGGKNNIQKFKDKLIDQEKVLNKKIIVKEIKTSHAFHTKMMNNAADMLRTKIGNIVYNDPEIPFVSNINGEWIKSKAVLSADYWANHIKNPVQFIKCMDTIKKTDNLLLMEIGPGKSLTALARLNNINFNTQIFDFNPEQDNAGDYLSNFLFKLGQLWCHGISLNWTKFYKDEKRKIADLSPYPFDRQKYWIEFRKAKKDFTDYKVPDKIKFQNDNTKENKNELQNDVENILIDICKEVTGYTQIDLNEDFFKIGINSLTAVQIMSRINSYLKLELPANILYRYTDIKKLSDHIKSLNLINHENKKIEFIKNNSNDRKYLTSSQQRMWFLHKFAPDNPIYNLAQNLLINGDIDKEIINKCLNIIINRHDIFISYFEEINGQPELKYTGENNLQFEYKDLTKYNKKIIEKKLSEEIINNSNKVYVFNKYPLYKFVLYKKSKTEYNLVLYIPHILTDGWTFNIFHKEFEELYNSFAGQNEIKLKDSEIQYADYAVWERKYYEKTDLTKEKEFWKNYLGNDFSVLQLPADYKRPKIMTNKGDVEYFTLPDELSEKIRKISSDNNVTTFVSVLSVLFILFYKYTYQETIIIGTPYANRNHKETESLMGFFLNMFPVKMSFADGIKFADMLKVLMNDFKNILDNKDIHFENILELFNIERQVNVNPLFQVMFAYQNYLSINDEKKDVKFEQIFSNRGISEYDISFYIWENEKNISGGIEYSTELFNKETIQLMIKHLEITVKNVCADPDIEINKFGIITDSEKIKLINEWNDTGFINNKFPTFCQAFKNAVKQFGSKTAVISGNDKLTYKELDLESDKLAGFLKREGVKRGDFVGICLDRNFKMLVSLLAVFKTGAAYIPLDPNFPADRLNLMMEVSGMPFIITEKKNLELSEKNKTAKKIVLDETEEEIKKEKLFNSAEISPEDTAYILFTSGSTGKPNGVQISHKALMNFLLSMKEKPGIKNNDKVLALTTLSFDISCLELFLPLITGASVYIINQSISMDGNKLKDYIINNDITLMQATPATYQMLLETDFKNKKNLKILCGGEALPFELAKKLLISGKEVWNMYGPTETTVWSGIYNLTKEKNIPYIGKPILNTQFYVLDKSLNIVPIGVIGELYIGGEGLSKGYLNNQELTNKRFIKNPFINNPDAMIYKTGDLVRYKKDGVIEYIGRTDFQVKIRGYRIELEEIENAISKYEGVKHAVCMIKENSIYDKRIIAYIQTDNKIEEENIKTFINKKIPDYMLPNHYIFMEKFPLTPNGKVNRKALPLPDFNKIIKKEFILPSTETEKKLSAIWQKLLNIKDIGVTDNYFDLGGHSLLAAILFSEIEKQLGVNLPLATLFDSPTIREIGKIIDSKNLNASWSVVVPIKTEGVKAPIFFVHGAEGNVLIFKDLAKYCNNDYPVYGIQSEGLDGKTEVNTEFCYVANKYITEIKKIQPDGPYYLGGYCLGGMLAYEIARQLKNNGDKVNLLALIESFNESGRKKPVPKYIQKINIMLNLIFHLLNLIKAEGDTRKEFFSEKFNVLLKRVKVLINYNYQKFTGIFNHNKKFYHVRINKLFDKSLYQYKAGKYQGNIDLFITGKNFIYYKDKYCGFKDFVDGIFNIHEIDCYPHATLVEPYVKMLADNLNKRLEEIK